ncbi:MAG TPA: MtrB/PioB family decaheme-associated outer membrane protein [Vicinamibacterales bacterium]|nr:MtrB/PioB family decaheme-associated outer membrane protein [Vicinamibacterales bacterium]
MRRLVLVHLIGCGVLVAPATAVAQAPAAAPASAQAPAATEADTRSLFDPRSNQMQIGGRFSSIDGDPARFQRYQDLRDGVHFTDARYARSDPGGRWLFNAGADNVGYRDQKYTVEYQRPGRFSVSGLWDEVPQFYSVDTKTPYTASPSPLLLPDATQQQIQNGQATLSAWVPVATQFDLMERRDIGHVNFTATPKPSLDLTAGFTTQKHVGELPWGASFGFGNDVEVALPYDSRTNDFTLGAEWTNTRQMLRVGYTGSWFDNIDDTLVWDSPLRLTDSTSAPGRGRSALWPSNSAQTISVGGYSKFAHRTQLTGFVSFGSWTNDQPLQPFTINATLPQLTLPRATAEAEANIFSTNLNLVSRPATDWRFSARVRHYGYDNQTPHAAIPQFINYDTSVKASSTGGPEAYAHNRTNFDADATWTGLQPVAVSVGYGRNNSGHDFRIFENTGENVFRVTADAVGTQWVTFRAEYELSGREGSGLNEELLVQIGEQPALRHYDVANRSRNRFTGQVDIVPNEVWVFSASLGAGQDDYDDSYFGLQESTFHTFTLSADWQRSEAWRAGASYTYESYSGFQQSRNANPGQETDPLRDWTTDSSEHVNYFSIYAAPPRFRRNTEARVSYDFSYAEGAYVYAIPPGSPLTPPNQLPNVYNKLQQLHVDVRHRLTRQWAATFSYLFEPFRVYDFAFDPTVVDSIVQPSSLVLGYVYRPYTAHSFTVGARYFW